MDLLVLLGSFVLLLAGAVVFTNAVEWAGRMLGLGAGAVGSILAAVATALPESVIPMVAIISGEQTGEIAIGAIIGAPLLLSTLAMLLIGVSARGFSGRREQGQRLDIHRRTTVRDLAVYLVCFGLALALGLIGNRVLNICGAGLLVLGYAVYVWRTVRAGGEQAEESALDPLYLDPSKRDRPARWMVAVQVTLGIAAIVGGAQLFVYIVEHLALAYGMSALLLALVLAPLATELPEKANSFIWIRKGNDALALGNISGAMVFQSMLPVAVGMAFTPWRLSGVAAIAAGCALVGGILALVEILRGHRFSVPALSGWAVLYGGFVAVAVTAG